MISIRVFYSCMEMGYIKNISQEIDLQLLNRF